ncbi:hypothetical protein C8Q79DRAFT_282508 [Trametes meyenii]|nr:hypothetical protein C8Q79DRAFT_282508 [Trametes meyenii]
MFECPNPSRINYGTSASHATVQAELSGRTAFNDDSVLSQIKIDDVDSRFVQECAKTLKESLEEDIRAFRQLVERAEQEDPKYLEYEALHDLDYPNPREVLPKDRRSYRQELVQRRLSLVLKHIQCAPEPDEAKAGDYNRCFSHQLSAGDCGTPEKDYTLGFPHFYPDFILTRTTQLGNPQADARTYGWHDRDGFVVIRPSSLQHPYPTTEDGLARPILTHAANCARIHLSARPFLLFSVCLLVFGGDFCVCVFDRAGARVSPKLNMWRDFETFIRVVRSMTRHLSDIDMGHDPSVALAPAALWSSVDQPAWIINSVDPDTRRWCTVGAPIWSSLSLFGRGTFVWYIREVSAVYDELRGPVMILKSAWRENKRDAESHIYEAVKGSHPGLAKYMIGADVVASPGGTEKITTHYLRQRSPAPDETTKALHRIVLGSVGRPIWEYDTEEQLIDGLISAIEAHKFLWDQKILHRDISAGNVFLAEYPKELGAAGFISDLDLAFIDPSDAEQTSVETVETAPEWGHYRQTLRAPATRTQNRFATQRGDVITGTMQFMSQRLLQAVHYKETSVSTAADDVESFFWVLVYAISRKLLAAATADVEKKQVLTHFRNTFCGASVLEIMKARSGEAFHDGIYKQATYCEMVSYPLRQLLSEYRDVFSGSITAASLPRSSKVPSSYRKPKRSKRSHINPKLYKAFKESQERVREHVFSHDGMIAALKQTRQDIQEEREGSELESEA